ncbi:uncharacterized protein LOC129763293 isoform X2 [Toxorhynchites rutilus septentrionalis]|uniref:uncharacterized protein LOC129763293 isoform X2 n=1 Tax=Toxorhynchites rutilus septentrionalis TaxID=329112 RepID=UPI00247AC5D6|nr:uncharacterized protein LOC129763293 isoform X2 [Toxorhynchites rutilus septentrionalis]
MIRRKHIYQLALVLLGVVINAQDIAEEQPTASPQVAAGASCRFPGAPAHSTVQFTDDNLSDGTVASYSCERGFELLGPSRRVCNNGQWIPEGIPFCVLNVAAGKAPMQISTDASGIPQKAIDGSSSSFFSPDTCSLTKPERVPWWYVNLLEPYMVQLVRLDFGKSCCGNGKPATIVVRVGNNRPDLGTNPICNRFTGTLEEGQPLFLPCNPPMPGAFVSVHLETNAPSQLSICEAFVYTDQALPIERCPAFRDMPPGASASYNGKCYIFYNRQPTGLRDALAFCRSRGGTLINESNPALQGFISWELWRRHRSDTSSQYWMGAVRDTQDRNTWKWIGGEEVSVSFWNLPGGDEDCARYDGSKGWLWSDTNCNTQLNFICQHQPKACGRPEQPPNSTMVSPQGFDVGATVEYNCDEGHLLVGPAQRTCLETGFYNEFPPVCKYIECGLPASIPYGSYNLINGSVGYLSSVLYRCDEGYEMVGRALLTCDIDERWNGPPPRCEIIECEPLPTLFPNGDIIASNTTVYGSRAEVVCNRGYIPETQETEIHCTATGQWSNILPKCVEDPDSRILSTTAAPTTTTPRPAPVLIVSTTTVPVTQYTQKRPQTRRPTRPTTRFTTSTSTTQSPLFSIEIDDGNDSDGLDGFFVGTNEDYSLPPLEVRPGVVREELPPRKPFHPTQNVIPKIPTVQQVPPIRVKPQYHEPLPTTSTATTTTITTTTTQTPLQTRPSTTTTTRQTTTTTRSPQDIILSQHPQDNEIAGSVNIQQDQSPKVNIPFAVDNSDAGGEASGGPFGGLGGANGGHGDRKEAKNARLNLGAIVALGAFGGFVFLAAVITTIVIVVRRNRTANQHYRHRASPDCNTVASFSSSSSESRNGLNRYYRQAWENLHETASKSHNSTHSGLKRKETMDAPTPSRSRSRENLGSGGAAERQTRDLDRSRENLSSNRSRDYPRDSMAVRDGSEMVVSDVCVKGEKKRHHHHHHKNNNYRGVEGDRGRVGGGGGIHRDNGDFREPNIIGSGGNGNGRRADHRHY